eukprot:gene12233-biopygen4327
MIQHSAYAIRHSVNSKREWRMKIPRNARRAPRPRQAARAAPAASATRGEGRKVWAAVSSDGAVSPGGDGGGSGGGGGGGDGGGGGAGGGEGGGAGSHVRCVAKCWQDVGKVSARCLRIVGKMLAGCWQDVGKMLAGCMQNVGKMLARMLAEGFLAAGEPQPLPPTEVPPPGRWQNAGKMLVDVSKCRLRAGGGDGGRCGGRGGGHGGGSGGGSGGGEGGGSGGDLGQHAPMHFWCSPPSPNSLRELRALQEPETECRWLALSARIPTTDLVPGLDLNCGSG